MQERTGALTAYAQPRISERDALNAGRIDAQLPPRPPLHCAPLSFHFSREKVKCGQQIGGGNKRIGWRRGESMVGV